MTQFSKVQSEDELIASLTESINDGALREDLVRQCSFVLDGYLPIAKKAHWAFERFCSRTPGWSPPERDQFIQNHLLAWQEFFLNAAAACSGSKAPAPSGDLEGAIVIGWHFPEYPLWLRLAACFDALVLVAREADWIYSSIDRRYVYCFRSEFTLGKSLVAALRQRRPVFAMLDYCYDETSSRLSQFLSYPSRTPDGIFQLARRFDYRFKFLSHTSEPEALRPLPISSVTEIETALDTVNSFVEKAILKNPSRWLLWASVDRRWVGAHSQTVSVLDPTS